MKILLLNPPSPKGTEYVRVERCMQKKSAWGGSLWQPLPLMYAQTILDKNGYETKLLDATAEEMNHKETIDFVSKENPDFLVVNIAIPTIFNDCKFAMSVKKKIKKVKTIAIGIPTNLLPLIISKYKFDYAIIGDVEYSILDILKGRKSFVTKKIGRTLFFNHSVEDLNKLPLPALHDLNLDRYTLPFTRERLMLIDIGRGCPFKCIFCLVPATGGRRLRLRNAKNIVDELERDYHEYEIKNFLFWTENATLNKKFMLSLCDEIIKRGLKIKWMTPSRVDTVDWKMLKKMSDAGCWMLSYGIESVDQKVLDLAKKGTTIKKMERAITLAHKAGIKVMAHIIIGLPGQTRESVERTIEWLIDKDVDYCQFYCAVPYWKTELRKIAEKNGWIESDDPTKYEIDKSVMRNDFLSSKDIEELRKQAFFKFYLRPKMIFKELLMYNFNPLYIANLVWDGIYFLKTWVLERESPLK
jgi:radical SAM superfamily enzyme YgiQ (UPF0313 family)